MFQDVKNKSWFYVPRCLLFVVCVLMIFCSYDRSALPVDDRQKLETILESRSENWAEGAISELIDGIAQIENTLGRNITPDEFNAISHGLADSSWEQPVESYMHPLLQQRNKLRILYGVESYLKQDKSASEHRIADAKAQLSEWTAALRSEVPGKEDILERAMNDVWSRTMQVASNPLRLDYMQANRSEEQLDDYWKESLAKLQSKLDGFSGDDDELYRHLKSTLRGSLTYAVAPKLIHDGLPESLLKAEQELSANISEVSEWNGREFQLLLDAKHAAAEHRRFISDKDIAADAEGAQKFADRSIGRALSQSLEFPTHPSREEGATETDTMMAASSPMGLTDAAQDSSGRGQPIRMILITLLAIVGCFAACFVLLRVRAASRIK